MRRTVLLGVIALLSGAPAFAQSVEWIKTSVVTKLDNRGSVKVEEIHELTASGDVTYVLRNLLVGPDQSARVHAVSLVGADGQKQALKNVKGGPQSYQAWSWGLEIWLRSEKDPVFDLPTPLKYSIEYTLHGGLTPAWDLAAGLQPLDQGTIPRNPLDRAREVLGAWVEAWPDLLTTYRFDHDVEFPSRGSPNGLAELNYRFEYDTAWELLDKDREIGVATPDVDYRVQRSLRYLPAGKPAAVDAQPAALRLAGAFGPFLLCVALALWFAAVNRGLGTRVRGDRALFERVIAPLPPESIIARRGGTPIPPAFDKFLLRMAAQRKLSITVEKAATDETDAKVSLRLLVPRSQLSPFERHVVDALFGLPDTVATSDIQDRMRGQEFDPDDLMEDAFAAFAPPKAGAVQPRMAWNLLRLGLAGIGLGLIVKSLAEHTITDPAAIFAGLVPASILIPFCPTGSPTRRISLRALVIVAGVFGMVGLALALVFNVPLPGIAALGLGLTTAGHFAGYLAGIPRPSLEDQEFEAAREWAIRELGKARPALRDAWVESLEALGAGRALAQWRKRGTDFTAAPDMADMGLEEMQAGPPFSGQPPRQPELPDGWTLGFIVYDPTDREDE